MATSTNARTSSKAPALAAHGNTKPSRKEWDQAFAQWRVVADKYKDVGDQYDAAEEAWSKADMPRVDRYFDRYGLHMAIDRSHLERALVAYNDRQRAVGAKTVDVSRVADEFEAYRAHGEELRKSFKLDELWDRVEAQRPTFLDVRDNFMRVPAPDVAALLVKMEIAAISLDDEHAESTLAEGCTMTALLDLAAIRARHSLPAIVGASAKLIRAGREWKACCPLHADRSPSFTIYADGERWFCFGCGAGGDVLDFIRRAHNVGLRDAVAMLEGGNLPMVVQPTLPPEPERDTTAEAIAIWRSAGPIAGTPASAYLHGRGLDLHLPDSLRFARLRYGSKTLPCMVALIANDKDKISGIQRTFVREDGSGKADVPTPKLSLGRIAGVAIRLAPAAGMLIVTGGVEDGLSLQQELGQAVWAATGEGNMANMILPVGAGVGEPPTPPAPTMTADEAYAARPAQTISRPGETVDQYRARRAAEFDAAQAKADLDAQAGMAAGGPLEVGVVGGRDDYVNGVGDPNAPKGAASGGNLEMSGTEADGTPIIQLDTPRPSTGNNAALVNGLKNAGAGRGIESIRDLPSSVADDITAARRSGVPDDQARREADVRYIGGEPTIGSTTRDPTAQRLEKVNANLDTPDGAALAQRAADNNAALHNTVQSSIEGYGGVPAQGEVSQTVAHSLANASDAEYAKVSALYKQGDEEAAAQAGSSDAATAQRQAEANVQAASDAQAAARKELDQAQAAHKAAKADPNADTEKTERNLIFARDALREATNRPPTAPAVPMRTGAGYIDISPLRQALDAPEMKNATIEGLNTLANGTRGYVDALSNGTNRVSASEAEGIRQAINDAYDIRGGAINGHVGRLKEMLDQSMDAATDAPASYRDARSAYKAWASKYQDPEGVANIIRRDSKGNFLNEDKWRSTDNGLIGTTNEQAFHQVTRRLLANRDVDTLNRMKAELIHRPYEAASKGAGDQNNHAVFSPHKWRDTINSIGMNKYRALFGKDEIAHLATIYRAAQALHEPVPGVVNGSNTGTTLMNAAALAKALEKASKAAKTSASGGTSNMATRGIRTVGHLAATPLHVTGLGALAHGAVEAAAGLATKAGSEKAGNAANKALAKAIRLHLDPSAARAAVNDDMLTSAQAAKRKALATALGKHSATSASAAGTGRGSH